MSAVRAARRRKEKGLRKIKIVPTDFKLTAASGLGTVLEIFGFWTGCRVRCTLRYKGPWG